MPGWWTALALVSALVPLPGLAAAAVAARSAAAVTPDTGPAPGLEADVPANPRAVLLVLGAAAVGVVLLQGIVGEHSLVEGLIRGAIEAAGLVLAVALLGRRLGLRR
jgi:hypothetical protein